MPDHIATSLIQFWIIHCERKVVLPPDCDFEVQELVYMQSCTGLTKAVIFLKVDLVKLVQKVV